MIAVVDYGMGNLRSVQKGLERVGAEALVTDDPDRVASARGVVLPGVGAFGAAMRRLRESGLAEAVRDAIFHGKPYLGICLGLQMLFASSDEDPDSPGLGVFRGAVVRFGNGLKVPHMGWNQVHFRQRPAPFGDVPDGAYVYFVHSYHVVPDEEEIVAATTDYGGAFVSAVHRENVYATQFHPEKSQAVGLRVLAAFAERTR
jgi:glutamine amidotransferase